MFKLILLLANVLLPLIVLWLSVISSHVPYRWFFMVFMFIHCFFRVWETYFTSKERNAQNFEGDWTLFVGTIAYVVLCFIVTLEFYLFPHNRNLFVSLIGLIFYIIAARLRLWGQASLGRQWAIHVIGHEKISKRRLLKVGPYQYVRHPIYLGILLEEFTLPILFNTYWSLIFVIFVNCPLLLIRLFLEEKRSENIFGKAVYAAYAKESSFFWPSSFSNTFYFFKKLFFLQKS
jgi:methyltransferase